MSCEPGLHGLILVRPPGLPRGIPGEQRGSSLRHPGLRHASSDSREAGTDQSRQLSSPLAVMAPSLPLWHLELSLPPPCRRMRASSCHTMAVNGLSGRLTSQARAGVGAGAAHSRGAGAGGDRCHLGPPRPPSQGRAPQPWARYLQPPAPAAGTGMWVSGPAGACPPLPAHTWPRCLPATPGAAASNTHPARTARAPGLLWPWGQRPAHPELDGDRAARASRGVCPAPAFP